MKRGPRGLSAEEAALWARVAGTVKAINPPRYGEGGHVLRPAPDERKVEGLARPVPISRRREIPPVHHHHASHGSAARIGEERSLDRHGLDGSWERKLARAELTPDFTLDLHGHGIDAAHTRLDHGLALALAQQARVVLVITGRPRPVEAADRGRSRGVIRAKLLDWLAAGPHASQIAAVRPAHRRHGGAGALYIVLRRRR